MDENNTYTIKITSIGTLKVNNLSLKEVQDFIKWVSNPGEDKLYLFNKPKSVSGTHILYVMHSGITSFQVHSQQKGLLNTEEESTCERTKDTSKDL